MVNICFVSTCDNEWPHLHIKPIEEIMSIRTTEIRPEDWFNWNGIFVDDEDSQEDFPDYLSYKRDEQYYMLKKSIEEHGFQPGFAPEIIKGVISEGHHRITLFYDIARWCPWQDTENWDQYNDDWEHFIYGVSEEVWNTHMSNA